MNFTYRPVPLPSDRAATASLLARTAFFRQDEIDVAIELIEEFLAKGEASGYYFWFADKPGAEGAGEAPRPAGYVCYGPTPCTIGSFDLYWIAVDTECQGQGLGRILATMAEESAAKMRGRKMYVETSGKAQYVPTQKFYGSIGYAEAARLRDFYDIGDDKVIFEKNIGRGA